MTERLVWLNAASTSTTARAMPTSEGSRRLSARRPPSMLPPVRPTPNSSSMRVTPWGADAGDVLQDWRDVSEDAEQAGRGQHAHAQGQQHIGLAQDTELAGQVGLVHGDMFRQPDPLRDGRDHADHRHRPEGRAPAGVLPEGGAQRYAEHIGQGQSGKHHRNGLGSLVRRDQPGGHHRTDAEERAVAQGRDHPRRHQGA